MRMAAVLLRISEDAGACARLISASNSTASLCETLTNIALQETALAPMESIGDLGQTRELVLTRLALDTAMTINNVVTLAHENKNVRSEDEEVRSFVGLFEMFWN